MAFQYRRKGFFTWGSDFRNTFLKALVEWSLYLYLIGKFVGWAYSTFPELYAYTFCAIIFWMMRRKLFLFYNEPYHTDRQMKYMRAALTKQHKIAIKDFLDKFLELRDAVIPLKRHFFVRVKASRQVNLLRIIRAQELLEDLIQKRRDTYAAYQQALAAVEAQQQKIENFLFVLYDRDDLMRFEADIDSPKNTVLRMIDQQLFNITQAYHILLIEDIGDEGLRLDSRRLWANRCHKEAYIERTLIRYYKKRYTDVWFMALENKRWYESLKHLIPPPRHDYPEFDDEDESTPKDLPQFSSFPDRVRSFFDRPIFKTGIFEKIKSFWR